MKNSFRQSMAWLHTWSGLIVGWVLYFIFVTGTAGYFYVELDRWMRPELPSRGAVPQFEQALQKADAYLRAQASKADYWVILLPAGRDTSRMEVAWGTGSVFGGKQEQRMFVPETGDFQPKPHVRETEGGYGLYRMHWKLHYLPQDMGVWIIGICTMIMLVALLSGIVTHRKIFTDFFTLRLRKGQRSWLDAHNIAGVLALPFFLMITYSGLIFYMEMYVPSPIAVAYDGNSAQFYGDIEGLPRVSRAGAHAEVLPLADFVQAAGAYWPDVHPERIVVRYPGDINAQISLHHSGDNTILRNVTETLYFHAATGGLVRQVSAGEGAGRAVRSAMFGLHEGIFGGAWVRWLYFGSGLLGCGMIATGLVLWTVKRRGPRTPDQPSDFGFRLVECLNIGTIVGLPAGIAAYLLANRLIPVDMPIRSPWEFHALFVMWGVMLVYPCFRAPRRAWVEELWATAALFGAIPVLNALTTDKHLLNTLAARDWAVAGVDIFVLVLAILCAVTAGMMTRRETVA